jgi:phosphohistidine phosphatase
MELYFLRHGVAEEHAPDGTDEARRLTEKGIEKLEAARVGLKRLAVEVDVLLTSPLARAYQTAEIVGRHLGIAPITAQALAPGCDVERLRTLLADYPRARRAMLVGHEPDFSTLVGALSGGSVTLKKGGLARVDLEDRDEQGTLIWLLPPRALR